jgi:AsmA protein
MYQIARKIRYVLRGLGILGVSLFITAAACAALLPIVVDAEVIRGPLAESLSAWAGGPVSIAGPLRIGSFADLSVQASGLDLKSTSRPSPIRIGKAKSVTAVIKLSSLLRGKLDFKKFVIDSPHVVFRRGFAEPLQPSYGLGAAHLALALSARSPFADVELRDPVFFFSARENGAYERAELSRVRLGKEAVSSISTGIFVKNAPGAESAVYTLDIASRGVEVSFRGQCSGACQTAFGMLRLKAVTAGGNTILSALAPWERPDAVVLSGELHLSRTRAALDDARISFGDHAAKGSIALDRTGVRPRLEGTIAYDTLDVTPAWTLGSEAQSIEDRPLAALPLVRAGVDRALDFDLRVSAERFRAASLETGPLALALTRTQDRLSVDIASVAVFGGHATGRVDVDPGKQAVLSLRGSGSYLDAGALANALHLPLGFSGPMTLQAALTMPMAMKPPPEDVNAAAGTFSARFPLGGSIEGDAARTIGAALSNQDDWSLRGSSFPFSVASIDGIVKPGGIDLKVQGQSGEKSIGGSLRIAFPGAAVSGTLLASENVNPDGSEFASVPEQTAGSTKLVLSGTAEAPILTSAGRPSLSN